MGIVSCTSKEGTPCIPAPGDPRRDSDESTISSRRAKNEKRNDKMKPKSSGKGQRLIRYTWGSEQGLKPASKVCSKLPQNVGRKQVCKPPGEDLLKTNTQSNNNSETSNRSAATQISSASKKHKYHELKSRNAENPSAAPCALGGFNDQEGANLTAAPLKAQAKSGRLQNSCPEGSCPYNLPTRG